MPLHPAAEDASYWARKVSQQVWKLFHLLEWPSPDEPSPLHYSGITSYELVVLYLIR